MPRVIGGKDAVPHSWPWQAEIQEYRMLTRRGGEREGEWGHKCGGSLIYREWIITAAHCLTQNPDPRIYRIILGLYTFKMVVKGSNETSICPFFVLGKWDLLYWDWD